MVTAGTSGKPSFLAASANPQPAITRLVASMTTGRTKPNCSMLACSLRICAGGCLRGSRPRGLESFNAGKIWIEIAGNGKAIPARHGLCFHHSSPSKRARALNHFGPNIMVMYHRTGPAEFTKLLSSRTPAPPH